jgi:hypothetical protein
MGTFRIEEQDAEASFGLILAHLRRGDQIVIERNDAMVASMPAPTESDSTRGLLRRFLARRSSPPTDTAIAAHPEALPESLPASRPAVLTSKTSWFGRRNRQS